MDLDWGWCCNFSYQNLHSKKAQEVAMSADIISGGIMEFLKDPTILLVIVGAMLAISEALALIPAVAANSIFQLVQGALKKIKEMLSPKENG